MNGFCVDREILQEWHILFYHAVIISTVGPTNQDRRILASCYQKCMELCELHNARTIVFPCIATGAFGFDHETAANIALSNVRAYLERNLVSGKDSVRVAFNSFRINPTCLIIWTCVPPSLTRSYSALTPQTISQFTAVSYTKFAM